MLNYVLSNCGWFMFSIGCCMAAAAALYLVTYEKPAAKKSIDYKALKTFDKWEN